LVYIRTRGYRNRPLLICLRENNMEFLQKAAAQFGKGVPTIATIGNGLIHRTYKVTYPDNKAVILQCINRANFKQPENIIANYLLLQEHLNSQTDIFLPTLLPALSGKYFWVDQEEDFWRATAFVANSYALALPANDVEARAAAACFARFTRALVGIPPEKLNIIIPDFHNLDFRYRQFETAIQSASINRLLKATHIISEIRDREYLVRFYNQLAGSPHYPVRILHHDCKISNILFDSTTKQALCAVDLDTVMPGYFFSDIGDMFRTMACTENEESTTWEKIAVQKNYYDAILQGYIEGMGNSLTSQELSNLPKAGCIMTYMQCIRFVTDFLNNDTYYKINSPEHNLNRALNQLIFLERLEEITS
jgi:Ser/Thr protein kinase RdoA (MazF antagonist)